MTGLMDSGFVWGLAIVQVLGLLSAWVARLSEGSRRQTSCQWLFVASLVMVALATIAALTLIPGCWPISGTTLAVMVLTVTCDFGRSNDAGSSESR